MNDDGNGAEHPQVNYPGGKPLPIVPVGEFDFTRIGTTVEVLANTSSQTDHSYGMSSEAEAKAIVDIFNDVSSVNYFLGIPGMPTDFLFIDLPATFTVPPTGMTLNNVSTAGSPSGSALTVTFGPMNALSLSLTFTGDGSHTGSQGAKAMHDILTTAASVQGVRRFMQLGSGLVGNQYTADPLKVSFGIVLP